MSGLGFHPPSRRRQQRDERGPADVMPLAMYFFLSAHCAVPARGGGSVCGLSRIVTLIFVTAICACPNPLRSHEWRLALPDFCI